MKEIQVYNPWKEEEEIVLIDDNMYQWLHKHSKELKMNNRGYPMLEAFGKLRPLHCVVYYLNRKIWSEQWKTAVHHKNQSKLDARIKNLELVDWDSHGLVHAVEKGYYATPRPKDLRIA